MRELVRNFVTKIKEIIKSFSEAFEEATKSEMDEKVTSEMEEEAISEMEERKYQESINKLFAYMCIFGIFLLISNFITKFSVASPSEQEWLKKIIISPLVLIILIFFSSLLKLKKEIMSLIKMFTAFIILVAMAIGLALLVNYAMTVNWDPIFSMISHMF